MMAAADLLPSIPIRLLWGEGKRHPRFPNSRCGELFFLSQDFDVGVGNRDAKQFVFLVEPQVPVGAVGLHEEVAEVLGTAV